MIPETRLFPQFKGGLEHITKMVVNTRMSTMNAR